MTTTSDRTAVITGAGSGIGRALALRLAARRCAVAVSDVDEGRLAETAARCEQLGAAVMAATVDVADRSAVDRHAAAVLDRFGTAELVFNNAGVAYYGAAVEQTDADIRRVLDVNLWGVINGSQAFLPQLIDSGAGHLVNVSSLFGIMTVPGHSAYCASKFAVRGYTEALATEMAAEGHPVGVSCVHPGGVDTNIARDAHFDAGADREELVELFGRMARTSADEAAAAILHGVEHDRTRIVVGADAKALHAMVRVAGGGYPRMVAAVTRRTLP